MANREAIRELQTRLASRLRSARDEGLSISWLAVRAGGHNYLFPLAQSGEIFPIGGVQAVPFALPWFLGVVNLRGGLYGVVDVAAFMADAADRPVIGARASRSGNPSVVTFNGALGVNCALLVDTLAGLRNPQVFGASVPPESGAPAFFGNRFTDAEGQVWQEINLQSLSQHPRFLGISAQAHF